jgi:hypothetical protein
MLGAFETCSVDDTGSWELFWLKSLCAQLKNKKEAGKMSDVNFKVTSCYGRVGAARSLPGELLRGLSENRRNSSSRASFVCHFRAHGSRPLLDFLGFRIGPNTTLLS